MTRHLRALTGLALMTVGSLAVGSASGVNPSPPNTGAAVSSIQLPRVTITDAAGNTSTVDLGALTARASTDRNLAASLGLDGGDILGTGLPGWSLDASGGWQSGDHDINITTGGAAAALHIVGYDVQTADQTAHSSFDALTGTATATPLVVQADVGQHGVDATVQPHISSSSVSLTVTGLQVRMGDLLPTDVLDALPLSGLIDLVSALGLPLPVGANSVDTQLADLTTVLASVQSAAGQLNSAQSAQQQVAVAQTQLANDLAALQAAQQGLVLDLPLILSLQQQVSADQAAVTAAQALVNAQPPVNTLITSLGNLLTDVQNDLAALPDLTALRGQLVSALTAAPLLDVGALGATATSNATDGAGTGAVTCTVTGASVLGQPVPGGPCSDLVDRYAGISSLLSGALAQLPLTQPVLPVLDGLAESTTLTTPAPADVDSNGAAGLTPLHVALPSATLHAIADPAVSGLTAALAPAQVALSGLGLPAVAGAVSGPLGTLGTTLASLPSGSGLAGLHTVGLDVSLFGLSTAALHHRSSPGAPPAAGSGGDAARGGGTGTGGTVSTPAGPARPPHASHPPTAVDLPAQRTTVHSPLPALPFTGDNAAVQLAAALIACLVGAHLVLVGRRARQVT
jgi:hypothetical protein